MSGDSVKVQPATHPGAIEVALDTISGISYPVYKISWGSLGTETPVTTDAPLPVEMPSTSHASIQQETILEAIENLNVQLQIMNIHLQRMTGEKITKEDLNGRIN